MDLLEVDDVRVPYGLLLIDELKATEKIVWMALTMDTKSPEEKLFSPSRLALHTGMSRPTVRAAAAKLTTEGLFDMQASRRASGILAQAPPWTNVRVPVELIMAKEINAQAKIVYAVLLHRSERSAGSRPFKYAELADLMKINPQTVKHAARQLAKHGWLEMEQAHKQAPIGYTLHNPVDKRNKEEIWRVQQALHHATYLGQALTVEMFLALVDSPYFDVDMRPGFLRNPETGHRLELDLFYYDRGFAVEFNGEQHYRTTEFSPAEEVLKQQHRDETKQEICTREKIKLVIIQTHELSWETIKKKIGRRLPLRRGQRLNRKLVRFLEIKCREYQRNEESR